MKNYLGDFWQDILDNKEFILLLAGIWIILFEDINLIVVLSGLILSVLVIIFTDRFLLKGNYEHSYMIGFGTTIKYAFRLIVEIYLAGLEVIPTIFTGKTNIQILETETRLSDELLIDILANSITLTPGTVSVNKKGTKLKILAIDAPSTRKEVIPLRLEEILLKYESQVDGKA